MSSVQVEVYALAVGLLLAAVYIAILAIRLSRLGDRYSAKFDHLVQILERNDVKDVPAEESEAGEDGSEGLQRPGVVG